jgi:D-tyrosyl-tRNA(Tyr) deacylase
LPQGPPAIVPRGGGPAEAKAHYEAVAERLRIDGLPVSTGEFQAMMRVSLVNDGPVTILLDSRRA